MDIKVDKFQIVGTHGEYTCKLYEKTKDTVHKGEKRKGKVTVVDHAYFGSLVHCLNWIAKKWGKIHDVEGIKEVIEAEKELTQVIKGFVDAFYEEIKIGKQVFHRAKEDSNGETDD